MTGVFITVSWECWQCFQTFGQLLLCELGVFCFLHKFSLYPAGMDLLEYWVTGIGPWGFNSPHHDRWLAQAFSESCLWSQCISSQLLLQHHDVCCLLPSKPYVCLSAAMLLAIIYMTTSEKISNPQTNTSFFSKLPCSWCLFRKIEK